MPAATPNAMEKQLVQGGTASERQLGSEKIVVVNGHQTTADEQILLDLLVCWPRSGIMPISNVFSINHKSSTSGITFT